MQLSFPIAPGKVAEFPQCKQTAEIGGYITLSLMHCFLFFNVSLALSSLI